MAHWETEITSGTMPISMNIRALFQYTDLVQLFVKRNFVTQYKQTVLGPLWVIIRPLLTTVVFTVVFGNLAGLPTDGVPPFLFYMCGNVTWTYFQNCLTDTSSVFLTNAGILGKVYFPRLVLPVSSVISQLISTAIQFAAFLVFWVVYLVQGYAFAPTAYLALLPFFFLQMALLGLGFGIIVSSLTTRYRDLAFLVGFGTQLWMYATPIAYATSLIPAKWLWLYMLNPMTPVIEGIRYALFGSGTFEWAFYGLGWLTTLIVCFIGLVIFNRVERTFMDTI